MQDLDLSNYLNSKDQSTSESDESDDDIDEFSVHEYPKATNICEKLIEEDSYILNIDATRTTNPNIAIARSNCNPEIFVLHEKFHKSATLDQNSDKIVDLKFSKENEELLWTGTYNGSICLWDLRTHGKPVSRFTDTTDDKSDKDRKFNSFDISSNGRLLCAGTEAFDGDSFLLFWDIRNTKLVGGYWESHTDDITQVKFHPTNHTKLLSGSTDGLINIYDLTHQSEDDALIGTLNTDSSVDKLNWSAFGSRDIISCVTHTIEIQFWQSEGVEPSFKLSRADLAKYLKRTSENYVYVAEVHVMPNSTLILGGSNAKSGECARGIKLVKSSITPAFRIQENKQRIRCSWYNENNQLLLTGGEKGYLNACRLDKNYL